MEQTKENKKRQVGGGRGGDLTSADGSNFSF